ncbi:MAG: hypothetical protein CME62_04330 [Halobacteriovoraceae bacterium]|nr:hypothetical protein [Halobacteriovoraceae bacterium]|tara:strand:- start:8752 stop:9528 length:777 start_codon:yes stop_codon:yes gene_type:complete
MKILLVSVLCYLFIPLSFAGPIGELDIEFDLADVGGSADTCGRTIQENSEIKNLSEFISDPNYWESLTETQKHDDGSVTYFMLPSQSVDTLGSNNTLSEVTADDSEEFLGMTQRDALLASRDPYGRTACSTDHIHDDIANRWCHGYLANNFANYLRRRGLNRELAALAGGVFWAPKEFFVDLNPSANDFVATYEFGDNVFKDNRYRVQVSTYGDVGNGSLPFVTLRVCLDSSAACARGPTTGSYTSPNDRTRGFYPNP